jgi:phosphopantetheinyl transferase
MPLIYQNSINDFTKIGVWHITETEVFFLQLVSLQRTITHPHKRLQHLAGRYLLRTLFPEFPVPLILIADTKKPYLENEAFHFSLSHCGNYAAAIVSTANRVGVDIEIPHNKIERVKHKFLSPGEETIIRHVHHDLHHALTQAWSIKEALFKWYGLGSVDFKDDMQILNITRHGDVFLADCIFKKELNRNIAVESIFIDGNNLSHIVT